MNSNSVRKFITHPALALGGTVLWGVVELVALSRARWSRRAEQRRPH